MVHEDLFFVLILILTSVSFCCSQATRKHGPTPYRDWDYLLFSQRWPVTACSQWEEAKQDNTCNLPPEKNLWTVHGIWPTKTGTEGPFFCPSAMHFDPGQLQFMMDDLKKYWTNVEANTKPNSFWKHEWDKHGTCASILPELDSVKNFFQQGLTWNKQYKLSNILERSKIVPSSTGYTVEHIYNAVKSYIKKEPMIQCVVDKQTKESMISEIRICFNKTMELIDCDNSKPAHRTKGIISNCNLKKMVMYFGDVPVNGIPYELDYMDIAFNQHREEQLYYMSIYKFLKFLIWFTT